MIDGFLSSITLTTANVNLGVATAWSQITGLAAGSEGPTGSNSLCPQVMWFDATLNAASSSAQLALVVWNPAASRIIRWDTIALTATTRRTAKAGAAGDYVATVAVTSTGTNKADLMDFNPTSRELWLGCVSITTATSLTVYPAATRAI